jgi:uncharacterized protein YyaL (SSP411 family)
MPATPLPRFFRSKSNVGRCTFAALLLSSMSHAAAALPPAEEIAKLPKDGGPEFNRLVFESSPYLRLHARNPVDWYPWGEAAFEKARREDKPVFLSVGYSTCHWCHVMARESFVDKDVAAYLNEHYVSVKLDREERPDIDEIYMTVTQAITGHGGWPMTVMMTHEQKPFFAGTYFPKNDRGGRPGFLTVLRELNRMWTDEREKITTNADQLTKGLAEMVGGARNAGLPVEASAKTGSAEAPPAGVILPQARTELRQSFDPVHGGFGRGTKFPTPQVLSFLVRQWTRDEDPETLDMVEHTLHSIRNGAVYDHLGHGIHRYSTDARWELPHFEKMLYDQALYVIALLDTYQATGGKQHAANARNVLGYVRRVMTSPGGGFYSAEDAQSEGVEGKFYFWNPEQIADVLGADDGKLIIDAYQVTPDGNFFDEATHEKTGESILRLPLNFDPAAFAKNHHIDPREFSERHAAALTKLFEAREKRQRPPLDDKVLTDWNGLMIAAMARAGRVLDSDDYRTAATRAAEFVLKELRTKDGKLLKRWRQGQAGLPAHLEDYAFLVWGLLELQQATHDPHWLREAIALNRLMIAEFSDEKNGGFFMTAKGGEKLIVRSKKLYGGAIPSGNSVAALNLLRLSRLTGDTSLEEQHEKLMRGFSAEVARHPSAFPQLLQSVFFAAGPSHEVVIVGKPAAGDTKAMLTALNRYFLPNTVAIFRPDEDNPAICELAPYTREQRAIDGKATAYVCQNFACNEPTTSVDEMLEALR